MRIDLKRRRRGSIVMEAALTMPVAVVLITLAFYVLEADLSRNESAVYARGSAMVAADMNMTNPFACQIDDSATGNRTDVSQTTNAYCVPRNGERGLRREQPFWTEMRSSASAWRQLIRDVDQRSTIKDITVYGTGSVKFNRSTNFFESQGDPNASSEYIVPREDFWDHLDTPWRRGHDKVVWAELRKQGTYRLFPNVFPSR